MEYTTQKELYLSLLPVFKVKKRLLKNTKYNSITEKDIWKYLAMNKWQNSINLTLSDIVNDIIIVDAKNIENFIGGK